MATIKSIEEKAKAYDEAIKYSQYLINERCKEGTDGSFHRADLDKMFPELAESEDERIRKELLNYLYDVHDDDEERASWIAWLEKQGGYKSTDKVEPKFKVEDRVIGVVSGILYFITEVCDDHYNTESGCIIMFCAQDNFELVEQKPTWSKEDEKMLNDILMCGEHHCYLDAGNIAWLKSLKDRVLPQPKQEWSEKYIADVFEKVGLAKIAREQGYDALTKAIQSAMIELSKFTPQPKQTWSKDDEKFINNIEESLLAYKINVMDNDMELANYIEKEINWLKLLI